MTKKSQRARAAEASTIEASKAFDKGTVYQLDISEIRPNPAQPRKYFDEEALRELAASIEQHGQIQPISFKVIDGKIVLLSGERRLRAVRDILKRATIAGILNDGDEEQIALAENIFRQDLTPIEEAEAYKKYQDSRSLTNEQLAVELKKSPQTISEILALNTLPEEIKGECRRNSSIPRRILVEIARKKKDRAKLTLFKNYKKFGLTREEIRASGEGTRTRKTKPQTFVHLFETLETRLAKLNMDRYESKDAELIREAAKKAIATLQKKFNLS